MGSGAVSRGKAVGEGFRINRFGVSKDRLPSTITPVFARTLSHKANGAAGSARRNPKAYSSQPAATTLLRPAAFAL